MIHQQLFDRATGGPTAHAGGRSRRGRVEDSRITLFMVNLRCDQSRASDGDRIAPREAIVAPGESTAHSGWRLRGPARPAGQGDAMEGRAYFGVDG